MSGIVKAMIVTFVIMALVVAGFSAMAARPAYTGMTSPPAVDGQTGSVTGRVTASTGTAGIAGAYIAVVNASNVSEEYFNTTSGEDGFYQITGINASYNAVTSAVGPNGPTPYKIYANKSPLGEGYSAAFGIDASGGSSSPATGISPITVAVTPTPAPSQTPASTVSPTTAPSPTPEPTVAPANATAPVPTATPRASGLITPTVLPLLIAVLIAIGASVRKKK